MAQAAQATDHKIRGNPPKYFTEDRFKSEDFLWQFKLFWRLNDQNEAFSVPYFRVLMALNHIKGPLVNDWVAQQTDELHDKTTCNVNQIGRDEDQLWNEFSTAFVSAFTDTVKTQITYSKLTQLKQWDSDLDTYIATFKNLAAKAGYELDAQGTITLFIKGLN